MDKVTRLYFVYISTAIISFTCVGLLTDTHGRGCGPDRLLRPDCDGLVTAVNHNSTLISPTVCSKMWKGGKISLLKVSNVRAPTPPQEVGKCQVRELSRPPVLPHPVIIPPEPVPQARHQYGGGGGYDNGLMGVLPSQAMISPPKKSNAKSGNQGNRWSNKDGSGGHGNKLLSLKNNNAKPPTKKTSTSKLPQDFQDTRPEQVIFGCCIGHRLLYRFTPDYFFLVLFYKF